MRRGGHGALPREVGFEACLLKFPGSYLLTPLTIKTDDRRRQMLESIAPLSVRSCNFACLENHCLALGIMGVSGGVSLFTASPTLFTASPMSFRALSFVVVDSDDPIDTIPSEHTTLRGTRELLHRI